MNNRPKPVVLAILDGWGVAPDEKGNAITRGKTPNMDKFAREYPAMNLIASGPEVGLAIGQMGSSEVGHLNIGAGRVYYQTLPRIDKAISDGEFFKIPAFEKMVDHVKKNDSALHIMGLLSNGNVHSSIDHCFALLELAKKNKIKKVFVHPFLDGRDAKQDSGIDFVRQLQKVMKKLRVGEIATLSGRYYAMDRDNRWDRIEKAYRALAEGKTEKYYKDPIEAIEESYKNKVYDEEFIPVVIGKEGKPTATVDEGDAAVFFDFRPDRARQLTRAFVLPSFAKFEREYTKKLFFVTMTEYEKDIPVEVAFAPIVVENCLAEVISKHKLKQLHLAETEKYAHVTFFLNGTVEDEFEGEDRKLIPSPRVSSYDQAPEMSSPKITKELIKVIDEDQYDVIIVNYAGADMVGHTGDYKATVKAVETIDKGLGAVAEHILAKDGILLITADHGNAEEVSNLKTGEKDKEHSTNPVPFIIVGNAYQGKAGPGGDAPNGDLSLLSPVGMLADVAPTVLKLLDIERPEEMTGRALI